MASGDLAGGTASIRGEELKHLARVLRLGPGDAVAVFDGAGRGFHGTIEAVERDRAVVALAGPEDPSVEPACRVTLLPGLLHGERMDWVVEKATEIGVARVVPVVSERSVVRPREGGWARIERWRRLAASAAKQSGRLIVPEIAAPASFEEVVEGLAAAGAARFVFDPSGAPAGGALAALGAGEAAVLVGPEGGWTAEELGRAAAAGWTAAGLGARTLRADTASIVALGLVLALHAGTGGKEAR